jgi:Protein of unknown function (DUF3592)
LLWLLALGGAAFCAYAVVQLVRHRGSDNWPTAAATVEKIEVRRIQDSDSHHFRPVVSFSFVVSEAYYSGEWVGPAFSTEQETRDFTQQNTPIGTKLFAQYKPDNPKWLRTCYEVLAPCFGQLEHWSLRSATNAVALPQPKPRASGQHLIMSPICSRDVAWAEGPNIRSFEHLF